MEIVIQRGKEETLKNLPEYSIALDGFVQGPQIDDENHKFSFDHHAGCSRFSTISACEQAWTAIMLGLDPEPYTVYCNDVDADVCTAIWCLKNPDRCKEPLVKKLIDAIGMSDRYAGAFEINGMKKVVEWVCAPETESKKNGDYEVLSNDGLKPILESILHRIDQYANGEASIEVSKQQTNEDFKLLRSENGWSLVESNDPHCLGSVWAKGIERVVVVRHLENKSMAVTVARKSEFIEGFPMKKIFTALNKVESGWGGSNTIGGAPRKEDGTRSKLTIKQITTIIDDVICPKPKPTRTSKKSTTTKKSTSKK